MLKAAAKRVEKIKRKREQEKFVNKVKDLVKKEQSYLDLCEEYEDDVDFIVGVSISYDDDLDVSAKTINGEILLNGKLFDKGDVVDNVRYVLHEITHCFQQLNNLVKKAPAEDEYLDDKNEQEAFQYQIQYMGDHVSEEEVQEYLEHLLDYHDIEGIERREKIKILTEKL